ncbi:hypothetical protein FQN50_002028 [Emmonsiellopsis sp. PD_5]|nr:hypothetical protein FQN50_002028 [Emmonsiellopsis sp. PD_5]
MVLPKGTTCHQDEIRHFIRDLPPGCSEYDATGLGPQDIEDLLQNEAFTYSHQKLSADARQRYTPGQYVIFLNIPSDTVQELSNRKHLGLFKTWDPKLQILLIKMRFAECESTSGAFNSRLTEKLNDIRPKLAHELEFLESTAVEGSNRTKEPDASFQPSQLPPGRSDKWPSLVVEIGYSESELQLERDARWWLTDSGGDVKIVIVIKIFRSQPRVHFQLFRMGGSSAHPRPLVAQAVTVSRAKYQHLSASGELVIPFRDLFLRFPRAGETDVVLSEEDLEDMSRRALK